MIKNPDSLLKKIPDLTDEHEKQIQCTFRSMLSTKIKAKEPATISAQAVKAQYLCCR